jgi:hypothetical protein
MKKLFSLCLMCILAVSAMAQDQNVNVVVIGGGSSSSSGDYVDLGLPSGTLWKRQNEYGFYTYEQALNRFGNKLPERHHFLELINECTWIWMDDYGYKVVGPNGNSITLPAAGFRNCDGDVHHVGAGGNYWSSTPFDSDSAWSFIFNSSGVYMNLDYHCNGLSVRLVQ